MFQRVSFLSSKTFAVAASAVSRLSVPTQQYSGLSYHSPAPPDQPWEAVDTSTNDIKQALLHKLVAKTQKDAETKEQLWASMSADAMDELERHPPHDPYTGRSIQVVDGNIHESFRRLNTILSRNKVVKQLRMTERHEKKGVKRRRLESERWRRLFAHEVRKNVQLVTKIRNRGA